MKSYSKIIQIAQNLDISLNETISKIDKLVAAGWTIEEAVNDLLKISEEENEQSRK